MGSRKIEVGYLARVEGESAMNISLLDGKVKDARLNIWEPPRFFEGFLVGRKYDEVGDIVARICGICPISHMTTAILAVEKATEIEVEPETVRLRRLMALSQIVASHLIHLYMLSLPDYLGYRGFFDMIPNNEDKAKRLLRMKEVMNGVAAAFGGRALHPISMVPGGFTSFMPSRSKVKGLIDSLKEIRVDALETVKMVADLDFPDFQNRKSHVALYSDKCYAINHGNIKSDDGLDVPQDEYPSVFEEEENLYARAKKSKRKGYDKAFMVGALPRVNLKYQKLTENAREAARQIGFSVPDYNPYHNNIAQSLEIVSGIDECITTLERIDFTKLKATWQKEIRIKEGAGGAITEAPRGLLYHWYQINKKGVIEKANIVTPTAHNFSSVEEDLKALSAMLAESAEQEIKLRCEQLVRAYDPCFSCSVH